jgi:hypothetical protein
MRGIRTSVAVVALLASAMATPGPRCQMSVQVPPPGRYEILSGARTVAFPFEMSANWILVPVRVNGSEPLNLILDTGMPMHGAILFDGPKARALGLGGATAGAVCGTTAASAVEPSAVLELPGLRLTGQTVMVMPPPGRPGAKSPPADGVIGLSLLGPFAVRIDCDAMTVMLTEAPVFVDPPGLAPIPLSAGPAGMMQIECGIEQADGRVVPALLIVDTGASHAVSLNVKPGSALALPETTIETSLGATYMGERLGRVGRVKSVRVGGVTLRGVVAAFPSSPSEGVGAVEKDGNLGNGILLRFNTTFDYSRSRLFLEPNARFDDPFEHEMSGMQLVGTAQGPYEVARVVPGSPADEAGISPGDRITAIDGAPAGDLSWDDLRALLREEGRVVAFRVEGAGSERTVTLTLRRLV